MADSSYLNSSTKQFLYYKNLAESAIAQLSDHELFWQYNGESNSVAMIIQHMAGNMLSRFSGFLQSDGEKSWRNRDEEFMPVIQSRADLLMKWNEGWRCLQETLDALTKDDLESIVYIRNEGHTVTEAINRQLAHYAYHAGQIVFIAKMLKDAEWQSLSIPRNRSVEFNSAMFSRQKTGKHAADEQ
jgi:hypothetical protein